jgi:hypothetical protein
MWTFGNGDEFDGGGRTAAGTRGNGPFTPFKILSRHKWTSLNDDVMTSHRPPPVPFATPAKGGRVGGCQQQQRQLRGQGM